MQGTNPTFSSSDAQENTQGTTAAAQTPGQDGSLCRAEESGYLDSTDVFCPFLAGPDYACRSGCPTNRERICVNGEDE